MVEIGLLLLEACTLVAEMAFEFKNSNQKSIGFDSLQNKGDKMVKNIFEVTVINFTTVMNHWISKTILLTLGAGITLLQPRRNTHLQKQDTLSSFQSKENVICLSFF